MSNSSIFCEAYFVLKRLDRSLRIESENLKISPDARRLGPLGPFDDNDQFHRSATSTEPQVTVRVKLRARFTPAGLENDGWQI